MIVVDTNVVLRGLRSRNGASFVILTRMLSGAVSFAASPAVMFEYEDVLKRPGQLAIDKAAIDTILDALCAKAAPVLPWFRFRPFLIDPKEDIFVECALAAGASIIVTGDRHFDHPAVRAFGLMAMSPTGFLATQEKPSQ